MALPKVGDGEQIGDGNLGEVLNVGRAGQPVQFGGTNTGTVGFFGATPVALQAATNQALVTTSPAVSVSATQWAFATSTQANGVVALANAMQAALVSLGLIKGSN